MPATARATFPRGSMPEFSSATTAEEPAAAGARLRDWLTSGRPQSAAGAYCAWRDAVSGELAFEYPEITGYALTWLAAQSHLTERAHEAGVAAADWLTRRFAAGDRSARAGWEKGAIYTFDLGMIAAGLISFGRAAKIASYEQLGEDVAKSLAGYIAQAGELPAVAPDGPATGRGGEWSTGGRGHLVKCVQALLLSDNRDAAGHLLEQACADQVNDGHFVTQPGDAFVMLHPHLYAIEGLWIWGTATGDTDALDRARRATEWVWKQQLPSGGFPRWTSDTDVGPEQLDATGQAVRAAILIGLRPDGLAATVGRLASCARTDGEHGSALVYRPDDVAYHLNVWVSMFGEQALTLACGESEALQWHELV